MHFGQLSQLQFYRNSSKCDFFFNVFVISVVWPWIFSFNFSYWHATVFSGRIFCFIKLLISFLYCFCSWNINQILDPQCDGITWGGFEYIDGSLLLLPLNSSYYISQQIDLSVLKPVSQLFWPNLKNQNDGIWNLVTAKDLICVLHCEHTFPCSDFLQHSATVAYVVVISVDLHFFLNWSLKVTWLDISCFWMVAR